MFEAEAHHEQPSSTDTHELRIAIFDLSSRALAGYPGQLSLLTDVQPLNDRGLPGITHERRAVNVGTRQNLGLPWMKVLGRLKLPEGHLAAYAVNASQPIDFEHAALKPYDLHHVHEMVEATVTHPESPEIDLTTAQLLHSAFSLVCLRRALR